MLTLTPPARAIAALILAFLTLTSETMRVALSLSFAFADAFPDGTVGQFLVSLVPLAIAVGTWFLAAPAPGAAGAWEVHVAGAARLLAALAIAYTALTTIGIVLNEGSGFANPFGGL